MNNINTTDKRIEFLLNDDRNCKSNNLQKFFRKKENRRLNEVIVFEDRLWLVSLGWLVTVGNENGFAGCTVIHAACFGSKAFTGYPARQNGHDYKIVTDWFWDNYIKEGILAFPDIWHIQQPQKLTSKEAHYN